MEPMPPVSLHSIVESLVSDAVGTSLPLFRPELILSATIVVMLLTRIFPLVDRIPPFVLAIAGTVWALVATLPAGGFAEWATLERQELFTGMLVYDGLTTFMRFFLILAALLIIALSRLTGLADRDDGQDFYSLLLGATIGMSLMASANHMLTVFLGVEMASVPSYVLAGMIKGRPRSSEAALKYAVYGAGTAGVMLYGISLLGGVLGSVHIPTMAQRLAELDIPGRFATGQETDVLMAVALGGLMLGVGLAFKLSAVPFHFWCPDVFEGAAAEVNAFLSVSSKAAALALLVRVGVGFGHLPEQAPSSRAAVESPALADHDPLGPAPLTERVSSSDASHASRSGAALSSVSVPSFHVATTDAQRVVGQTSLAAHASEQTGVQASMASETRPSETSSSETSSSETRPSDKLSPVRGFFVGLLGVIAVITCTFGNLTAYGQTNIKRMLAYSTIAHAGYMMMPVAAAVALLGRDTQGAAGAIESVLLYLALYLFMNLGAFAIVAFLRNALRSEEIKDYAGLVRSNPLIAIAMTVILFSLVGLPPLAGFIGKFRVFQSLVEAGGPLMIFLLTAAGLNTALSLVYYLRVAKTMCIDEPHQAAPATEIGFLPSAYVVAVTLPIVVLGVLPNRVAEWASFATAHLFG